MPRGPNACLFVRVHCVFAERRPIFWCGDGPLACYSFLHKARVPRTAAFAPLPYDGIMTVNIRKDRHLQLYNLFV